MSAESFKTKGNEHFKCKNYAEAFQMYSKAIELDPSNSIYYCNRAACYCAINLDKYFPHAILDAERAIELDPSYAKAHGRVGWICEKKGGITKAIINYQRAINCLLNHKGKENMDNATMKQLELYQQQMKLCQSKAKILISDIFTFHAQITKNVFEKDKMKEKYKNYFILTALGIPEKHIPKYTGSDIDGEKPLSLNDVLQEITLIVRILGESPKATVEIIDKMLVGELNKKETSHLDMGDIKQCVEDIDEPPVNKKKNVDHALKYEEIEALERQKKEFEQIRLKMDKNNLEGRGMMGLMEWKYNNKIRKIKEAIQNNETDKEFERYYDGDELNEDDDVMGYPDCMAKRLLFEHGLNPWDEGVNAILAKMYNW